jgi:hypothetical protein
MGDVPLEETDASLREDSKFSEASCQSELIGRKDRPTTEYKEYTEKRENSEDAESLPVAA